MARQFWAGEDPLGKTIRFSPNGPDVEIVGVARDIKYYDLNESPIPYLYRPFGQADASDFIMIVRTDSDPARFIPALKSELNAIDANLTWEHAMDFADLRREVMLPARAMLATSSFFGVIALVITAIGIYGVISYSVNRRTAEIGVRIALGADRRSIQRMVVGDGLRLAVIGCLAGLLMAFGVTRFLSSQLFGVTATDPLTYFTITALMLLVAAAACFLPARRATQIPPTLALKGKMGT
jgi:putative ABC transport system permease protein